MAFKSLVLSLIFSFHRIKCKLQMIYGSDLIHWCAFLSNPNPLFIEPAPLFRAMRHKNLVSERLREIGNFDVLPKQ